MGAVSAALAAFITNNVMSANSRHAFCNAARDDTNPRMNASPTAPAIVLDKVHLTLEGPAGPVNILRGVDLTVTPGTALGVVGPSGSGKTTMLMIVAGLEGVSSGRV